MPEVVEVANPGASAFIWYVPVGRAMRRNRPLPAVVVSRCRPVAVLLTVTLAPAILAPFSSRIAPTIPPWVVCAKQLRPPARIRNIHITMRFSVERRIDPPRYSYQLTDLLNRSLFGFRVAGRYLVLVNDTILQHQLDMLEHTNIRQRIALDGDHVGKQSRADGTDSIGPSHQLRGVAGARLERRHRGEAEGHHGPELASVEAMRIDTGIGTEGNAHAIAKGIGHVLLGCGNNHGRL